MTSSAATPDLVAPPESAELPPTRRQIEGLDGLRALAASMVLVFHFTGLAQVAPGGIVASFLYSGWIGVDIFFAISGFILFLPWARAAYNGAVIDRRRFFRNRLLRIIPAYWFNLFVLTAATGVGLLFTVDGARTLLGNFTFTAGYVASGEERLLNSVAWSLYCEMAFYLVLPFVARFFVGRRWMIGLPTALIVTMAYRWWAISAHGTPETQAQLRQSLNDIPATFDQFLMGMLIAAVWAWMEARNVRMAPWLPPVLMVVGVLGLYGTLWTINSGIGSTAYWHGTSVAGWLPLMTFRPLMSLSAAVLILGLSYETNMVTKLLSWRPLVYVGVVSYGLYLWHLPVGKWIVAAIPAQWATPSASFAILMALGSLLAFAWSVLSFEFIERRFLGKKERVPIVGNYIA